MTPQEILWKKVGWPDYSAAAHHSLGSLAVIAWVYLTGNIIFWKQQWGGTRVDLGLKLFTTFEINQYLGMNMKQMMVVAANIVISLFMVVASLVWLPFPSTLLRITLTISCAALIYIGSTHQIRSLQISELSFFWLQSPDVLDCTIYKLYCGLCGEHIIRLVPHSLAGVRNCKHIFVPRRLWFVRLSKFSLVPLTLFLILTVKRHGS